MKITLQNGSVAEGTSEELMKFMIHFFPRMSVSVHSSNMQIMTHTDYTTEALETQNPMSTRTELIVYLNEEVRLAKKLRDQLLAANMNASNTVIVTVSTDYSSLIGQYLRHQLTHGGEICDGFGVDVPYPDQRFDDTFKRNVRTMFDMHADAIEGKTLLLVEAGVIRGSNYETLVRFIRNCCGPVPIKTLAMYENVGSRFKSDFVGEYYDDACQDLTFWWEMPNNHWRAHLNKEKIISS